MTRRGPRSIPPSSSPYPLPSSAPKQKPPIIDGVRKVKRSRKKDNQDSPNVNISKKIIPKKREQLFFPFYSNGSTKPEYFKMVEAQQKKTPTYHNDSSNSSKFFLKPNIITSCGGLFTPSQRVVLEFIWEQCSNTKGASRIGFRFGIHHSTDISLQKRSPGPFIQSLLRYAPPTSMRSDPYTQNRAIVASPSKLYTSDVVSSPQSYPTPLSPQACGQNQACSQQKVYQQTSQQNCPNETNRSQAQTNNALNSNEQNEIQSSEIIENNEMAANQLVKDSFSNSEKEKNIASSNISSQDKKKMLQ